MATTTPFSFERPHPTTAASGPTSAFDALFGSHLSSTSSSTLATLSALACALLEHRVNVQVATELDQLRGELRDEYRPRVKALKADYMARIVWDDRDYDAATTSDTTDGVDGDGDGDETRIAHPTIMSDVDGQTDMSTQVDRIIELKIENSMLEARDRIESGVRRTRQVELEIWLSSVILDAYTSSAGDEAGAARWIQTELEDALLQAGIDLDSLASQSSRDLDSRFQRISVSA